MAPVDLASIAWAIDGQREAATAIHAAAVPEGGALPFLHPLAGLECRVPFLVIGPYDTAAGQRLARALDGVLGVSEAPRAVAPGVALLDTGLIHALLRQGSARVAGVSVRHYPLIAPIHLEEAGEARACVAVALLPPERARPRGGWLVASASLRVLLVHTERGGASASVIVDARARDVEMAHGARPGEWLTGLAWSRAGPP
jgi:hypothetical protein